MELVYLWVEEYKNIKKQGFNFSPRFKCEFKDEYEKFIDKDEKEKERLKKDCELIINEKEDYVNIFPDNINITAIVGENGSGKTNLIRVFFNLLFNKYKEQEDKIKSFLLISEKQILKKIVLNSEYFRCLNRLADVEEIDFFNFYINYSNDIFIDNKEIQHKTDNYVTPLLIEQNYSGNVNYLIKKRIHKFYSEIENNQITNFFNPNKIEILYKEGVGVSFIVSKYESLCESFFEKDKSDKFMRQNYISNIKENIQNYYEEYNLKNLNIAYIIYKYLSLSESRIDNDIYVELKELLENIYLGNVDFNELIILFENKIDDFKIDELERYDTLKIFDGLKFHEFLKDKGNTLLIKKGLELGTFIELENKNKIDFLPSWINIEFFDHEIKFESLSTGEKSIFILIITLLYQLKNLNMTKYSTVNVILDEIEMNIHPLWQKKFLKEIIFSINKISNKKISLILLTHSPFLLSDIPKENVIFLEKGKQVYPFDDNQQTFGANIHTLLSHGFFMKDGLMGEFAKDKIQNVINYHNDIKEKKITETIKQEYKEILQKQYWQIQSIIGDDYLKQVIKNHLIEIETIILGNDEAKKEEVIRLKAQIELLEK